MNSPIDLLTAWLQRPVYNEGVVLYERLIGGGFLLTLLKTGEDDYNREKLTTALSDKLLSLQADEKALKESYPVSLITQLDGGGLLMDERTILKERMRTLLNGGVTKSEELKQMAFRILAIKDELDGIYGRKHFFEQNGFLPEQASLAPELEAPELLLRRRNTLRTYVTKYTALLAQPLAPNRQRKYLSKLEGFLQELHGIDTHLAVLSPTAPPL
ncbi:hypothetical protein [Spirosoma sp.]|uniref:hypothetical protein n=1 Tax=Spirosoma sp. TaxID=1899569 RepID=UPI002613D1D8|nr:hypothetical protein [Spirosoma sp.]MCX6216479.1 hypothetical protein [Spirosoma sp.]